MTTQCARDVMNLEMKINQYSLWFVVPKLKDQLVKVPVSSFEDAESIAGSLVPDRVIGVRIARFDPTEGCESVLYKFN